MFRQTMIDRAEHKQAADIARLVLVERLVFTSNDKQVLGC